MNQWRRSVSNKKAVAFIEYTLIIVVILAAVLLSQKYIQRAFTGRWEQVSESFGQGRLYDPKTTTECVWSDTASKWYSEKCYDEKYQAYYQSYFQTCLADSSNGCIRTGTHTGSCGGSANCPCAFWNWVFLHPPPFPATWTCQYHDPNCCYNTCDALCSEVAKTQSLNDCLSVGGVNCN